MKKVKLPATDTTAMLRRMYDQLVREGADWDAREARWQSDTGRAYPADELELNELCKEAGLDAQTICEWKPRQLLEYLRLELKSKDRTAPAEVHGEGNSGAQPPILAILDDVNQDVLTIASDERKSSDDKMRDIIKIESSYRGWQSNRWAKLLGVSDSQIRKNQCWKELREDEKSLD
jgi:hypothetical protein